MNAILYQAHNFADAAILRRSLVGMKWITRNRDGSDYARIEERPLPEAVAVICEPTARRT